MALLGDVCVRVGVERVIWGPCLGSVRVLESDLHQAMKRAAVLYLADGCYCRREYTPKGRGSVGLRVDIQFTRKMRDYMVECETRPSLGRLIKKGERRNRLRGRTIYILTVPEDQWGSVEWRRLRGYFDKVLAYDAEEDSFTFAQDLRTLGPLRDAALDVLMPVILSRRAKSTYHWLRIRKNLLKWNARALIQCTACKLGIETRWIFCPRYNCPDTQ